MAIIRPIHGEMSGSIAGNTWSRNKGGQYVRQRSTPTNPNTERQQAARAALATTSAAWQSLDPSIQAGWVEWAANHPVTNSLGESIVLTGQQAFVALNSRLLSIGGTISDYAPLGPVPDPLVSASGVWVADTTTLTLTFAATPLPTGLKMQAWWTGLSSPGRDPNIRQASILAISAAAQATSWAITTPVAGGLAMASNLYLAVVGTDGQASVPIKARVVVEAAP